MMMNPDLHARSPGLYGRADKYSRRKSERERTAGTNRRHAAVAYVLVDPYRGVQDDARSAAVDDEWLRFVDFAISESHKTGRQRFELSVARLQKETAEDLVETTDEDVGARLASLMELLFEERPNFFLGFAAAFLLAAGAYCAYGVFCVVYFDTFLMAKFAISCLLAFAGVGFLDVWRRLKVE